MLRNTLLTGKELEAKAIKLGVSLDSDEVNFTPNSSKAPYTASEATVQRRIIDAEKHLRERWLVVMAVVAAVTSIISAITALIAVWIKT